MPTLDDDLSAQVERFLKLHKQGLINDADLRAALRGLNLSADDITRIEHQINVAGNYIVQSSTPAPDSSPTLDADTAPARYLRHVIDSNRRLQLQGIRSSSGLVSIKLEEIYITLTATERRPITSEQQRLGDEQQWINGYATLSLK